MALPRIRSTHHHDTGTGAMKGPVASHKAGAGQRHPRDNGTAVRTGQQRGHGPHDHGTVSSDQHGEHRNEVRDAEYRLTPQEKAIWSAAVSGAGAASPVLLSALTMLQPYKSKIVDVAAIDQDWRVALGNAFFQYTQHEREAIVIHECLHVTCNHFARARIDGQSDAKISNAAEDLEINQMVASLRRVRLPQGALYPNTPSAPKGMGIIDVPAGELMESYYRMISNGHGKDDIDEKMNAGNGGSGQAEDESSNGNDGESAQSGTQRDDNSRAGASDGDNPQEGSGVSRNDAQGDRDSSSRDNSGSNTRQGGNNSAGNTSPNGSSGSAGRNADAHDKDKIRGLCGNRDIDRVREEADEAGVRKVRPASKSKATERMLDETAKRMKMNGMPGVSTLDQQFIVSLNRVIHPPELNWRQLLRTTASDLMSKQAYQKTEYSFKRVNRRGSAFMKDCAFPSMVGYAPIVMMGIDTSGSRVDGVQFEIDMSNAQDILKSVGKLSKKSFSAFCVDTSIKRIQPVPRIEDLDLTGGGGTDMSVAFEYVSTLPRRKRPDIFVLATDGGFDWDKCAKVWPDNMKVIILITDSWYLQPGKIPNWVYTEAKVIDCSIRHSS